TLRHADSSVAGRMTLSTRLNHLPPLTPSPSAETMRSVQIDASTHPSPWLLPPVVSLPCLASAALPEILLRHPRRLASRFLPPFPAGRFCFPPPRRSKAAAAL